MLVSVKVRSCSFGGCGHMRQRQLQTSVKSSGFIGALFSQTTATLPSSSITTQSPSSNLSKTSSETLTCGNNFFLPESFVINPAKPLDNNGLFSATSILLLLDTDNEFRVTSPRMEVFTFHVVPSYFFTFLHREFLPKFDPKPRTRTRRFHRGHCVSVF